MAGAVTVEGADQLARTLGHASEQLGDLTAANSRVAAAVAARAASIAPRVTGRLAASVRGRGTPDRAEVTSPLPYAGPIHFGWRARNISPDPFITNAFDESAESTQRIYVQGLDDILATVKGA